MVSNLLVYTVQYPLLVGAVRHGLMGGSSWTQRGVLGYTRGMNLLRLHLPSVPVLALLACAACGPAPALSNFVQPRLHLELRAPAMREGVSLHLKYDPDQNEGCPVLPDNTVARINGQPLEVYEPGGQDYYFWLPRGCAYPVMVARGTPQELGLDQEVSLMEVSDGRTTLTFEALNVFKERTLTLDLPQDATLRPGQQVAVRFSVRTDQLSSRFSLTLTTGQLQETLFVQPEAVSYEQDRVLFTMPAFTSSGSATLTLQLSGNVGARRCEGLSACVGEVLYEQSFIVNLSP
jgi:hypothetical protein